jgi:hypothetical protein
LRTQFVSAQFELWFWRWQGLKPIIFLALCDRGCR